MDEPELTRVVGQVGALVEAHYVFPDVAAAVSRVLADGLAEGRYPAEARSLATAVTADLQSVNGDKHLRLLYHEQALPERAPGDDTEEYAAMARWAGLTCGGVACVQSLAGRRLLDRSRSCSGRNQRGEHHRRDDLLVRPMRSSSTCATAWAASLP
jgi:hypothetical protein